jgi:hypothetical protein
MKKISNDDNFSYFLNKFVNVEVDGTVKKFFVSEINSGSIVTDAGILMNYDTLGTSTIQGCPVPICEKACFNNIPIIELNFGGKNVIYPDDYNSNNLIDNKFNELHDVYINSNQICRINTSILSADFNRLWLIPYNSQNIKTPTIFDDYYNIYTETTNTTAASCIFFNPSFYNNQNWNSLEIKPISAYNPTENTPIDPVLYPIETFFTHFFTGCPVNFQRTNSTILTNKILVNSSNVSSISCVAWFQYNMQMGILGEFNSSHCPANINTIYYKSTFKPYTECQQVSTFFIDLDPCKNPTEYGLGFSYNSTRYYTNTAQDTYSENGDRIATKYAYTPPENPFDYSNFGAPVLRKFNFYGNCSRTQKIVLYQGYDPRGSNTQEDGGQRWYTNLGRTPFTGYYYYIVDTNIIPKGRIYYQHVVNGYETDRNYC